MPTSNELVTWAVKHASDLELDMALSIRNIAVPNTGLQTRF